MADSGRFYAPQEDLDVFAIFGLHAEGPPLSPSVLFGHFRDVLAWHVLEFPDGGVRTSGPGVPSWARVHMAWDALRDLTAAELHEMQTAWNRPGVKTSIQSWNPFAEPGSAAALDPAGNPAGQLPPQYYAAIAVAVPPLAVLPLLPAARGRQQSGWIFDRDGVRMGSWTMAGGSQGNGVRLLPLPAGSPSSSTRAPPWWLEGLDPLHEGPGPILDRRGVCLGAWTARTRMP